VIRAVLNTATGPLVVLGVVEENLRRMRDGHPLTLDLGALLRQAAEDEIPLPDDLMPGARHGRVRLAVMYGATHRAIVEEINRSSPAPLPPETLAAAEQLDAQLREEGLL
jgi:hypothetical protein